MCSIRAWVFSVPSRATKCSRSSPRSHSRSTLLPRLIAPGIAAELALTGRRFDAAEAKDLGLVNAVHADAEAVRTAALEMAAGIASKSPLAIAGIKHSLTYARDHSVSEGLEQIATWNGGMLRAEDLMGAMHARMAKTQAVFKDLISASV